MLESAAFSTFIAAGFVSILLMELAEKLRTFLLRLPTNV